MTDEGLEKIGTIVIDYNEFRTQLRRNYLDPEVSSDECHVLRLKPPFKQKMKAEPYSFQEDQHSDQECNGQSYHIKPKLIFEEANPTENIPIPWPTEQWVRNQGDEIAKMVEATSMEAVLNHHRVTYFWLEFDHHKPNKFTFNVPSGGSQTIELEWQNTEF